MSYLKNTIITLLIISSVTIIGCAKSNMAYGSVENSITQMKAMNITRSINKIYKSDLMNYDFGDESYISTSGRELHYKIKGTMGIPKGEGKFPIAIIVHGSHENIDESKRFDTGFDYLVENLSENGYIAVSVDVSKAYIWKYGDNDDNEKVIDIVNKQIENLKLANEGKNLGYSINLKDKIDFDKVSLIGHSRGGEHVFDIANDQISKGQKIQSVLSVAPTKFLDREYKDYDVSILVPEYDGDVATLDGFKIYDELKNKNRNNLTSVTLLEKANHNYFNKNVLLNDAKFNKEENELYGQLTREDQEKFLSNFAVDFLNASISKNIKNTMYDLNSQQPNKMYGYDVKIQSCNNKLTKLVDIKDKKNFISEEATVENTQDSWFYGDDKVILDTLTSGEGESKIRPLINIKWKSNKDKVKIIPKITDFSKNDSLILNLLMDSSHELNERYPFQRFSIELKDKQGNLSKAILPENLVVLGYTPGKINSTKINDEDFKFWSSSTPIGQLKLPLSDFKNIDFKNIDSISLIFDETDSGSILIDSIELQ